MFQQMDSMEKTGEKKQEKSLVVEALEPLNREVLLLR